ncbi:unnamed protein product [Oppiella nova]|uniref:Uncharacterized protein n=1 Tax=Oppiella nova TaxID=334625 RepID=A0A7R9LVU5_9ACAR|nr:unnamed protein product [Oppiella nova]CAG2167149.1 unnamed protein product [Oppiella nova]
MSAMHVLGFYGWYLGIKYSRWQSWLWAYFIGFIASFGVLAGSHRLWTHRSYKVNFIKLIFTNKCFNGYTLNYKLTGDLIYQICSLP